MLDLGNMTLNKIFDEEVFEKLKHKESFQRSVNSKGKYVSCHEIEFYNPMISSPCTTRIDTKDKVTFIYASLKFSHDREFYGYLVYYNSVVLQVPYSQITGHSYHWFITNLVYSFDEFFIKSNGKILYEEDIRDEYLRCKIDIADLTYEHYINHLLGIGEMKRHDTV